MMNFNWNKWAQKGFLVAFLSASWLLEGSSPPIERFIPFQTVDFNTLPRFCYNAKVDSVRQKLEYDFNAIFSALNYLSEYEGLIPDPNFMIYSDNEPIALANTFVMLLVLEDLSAQFQALGIPEASVNHLEETLFSFIGKALIYCLDMNMQNTAQPSGDPNIDAYDFLLSGIDVGMAFAGLTGNLDYVTLWSSLANSLTQNMQAYRGVLNTPDFLGEIVNSSDPLEEAVAAALLSQQINASAIYFSNLFVFDWTEKNCAAASSSPTHAPVKKPRHEGGWERHLSKYERLDPLRQQLMRLSKKIQENKRS